MEVTDNSWNDQEETGVYGENFYLIFKVLMLKEENTSAQ